MTGFISHCFAVSADWSGPRAQDYFAHTIPDKGCLGKGVAAGTNALQGHPRQTSGCPHCCRIFSGSVSVGRWHCLPWPHSIAEGGPATMGGSVSEAGTAFRGLIPSRKGASKHGRFSIGSWHGLPWPHSIAEGGQQTCEVRYRKLALPFVAT